MNVTKNISMPLEFIFSINELVNNRQYKSFSSFVQQAIKEKLDKIEYKGEE